MNIIHGSSLCLARACRRAGESVQLRNNKRRFLSQMVRWDSPARTASYNWEKDLFLAYPDEAHISNAPKNYQKLVDFYRGNKYQQWQECRRFFKTPEFEEPPYVRRPLRHEGGVGFVIDRRPKAQLPGDHDSQYYWRSLFERSSEYRVFFTFGRKVLTLLKRVPESTSQEIAWNHGVSSFVTVHDDSNDRLRHSKFYAKAVDFFKEYPFHLCAVDVLYNRERHRVVEVNFSPGVLIEDNLHTLVTALLNARTTNDSSNPNTATSPRNLTCSS